MENSYVDIVYLKMIWYSRWLVMNYDTGILMTENGVFYAKSMVHFEKYVYPEWVKRHDISKEIEMIQDYINNEKINVFDTKIKEWDGPGFKKIV